MVVKLSKKKYFDLEVPPGMMAKVVKGIYFDVFNLEDVAPLNLVQKAEQIVQIHTCHLRINHLPGQVRTWHVAPCGGRHLQQIP